MRGHAAPSHPRIYRVPPPPPRDWHHCMKDHVEISHLTKFHAFRINGDQVMDLETWFKIHTNFSNDSVPQNHIVLNSFKISVIFLKMGKYTWFSSQLLSNGSRMTKFYSCHKADKKILRVCMVDDVSKLETFVWILNHVSPCIRLERGKFELTNQGSTGGKKSSVLTSSKQVSKRLRNQATFLTGNGIKYPRKGIYIFKNHTSLQKVKYMNHFVLLRFYFSSKNGSPALGMATRSLFVEYRQVG